MKKYIVYNGFETRLFETTKIIEAKNGSDACKKVLKDYNIPFTRLIRSASNMVKMKAQKIDERDGKIFYDGNATWFEVKNEI